LPRTFHLKISDDCPNERGHLYEILSEKGLMLKAGSAVDATLISAPSSTKNGSGAYFGERDHAFRRIVITDSE
jgi:hypothetical protein